MGSVIIFGQIDIEKSQFHMFFLSFEDKNRLWKWVTVLPAFIFRPAENGHRFLMDYNIQNWNAQSWFDKKVLITVCIIKLFYIV